MDLSMGVVTFVFIYYSEHVTLSQLTGPQLSVHLVTQWSFAIHIELSQGLPMHQCGSGWLEMDQ